MPHNFFRRLLIGAATALPLVLTQNALAQDKTADPVIAVVEGKEIHKSDFTAAYNSLPPRMRQQGIDTLYPHVLELLIQQMLIIKKGREANLANDPEIKQQIARMEDRLIHDTYLSRKVQERLNDDVLHAEYEKILVEHPPAEEIHARHILVETETKAREVIELLGQGQDFADLAKRYSKGPSAQNGGDLGYFGRGKMVQEFEDAAFALKPNTYTSEPVQTRYGWHVILVEDKRAGKAPTFEEMRPRLTQLVAQSMAYEISHDIVKKAKIKRFDLQGNEIDAPDTPLPLLTGQQ